MRKRENNPGADRQSELVIQSLDEGVIVLDGKGRVTTMNQAAEELTGCSLSSTEGRRYSDVFRHNRWLCRLIGPEDGHVRAEGSLTTPWTGSTPVRVSVSPMLDRRGKRTGTVVVLRDLAVQKSLETDLQRATNVEQLGSLVADLAHEIKNPLGGIRGAVQLLGAELGEDSPAEEYVGLVLREVDRLKELLERLLQLGRGAPLRFEPVNIHRVIDHVIAVVSEASRRDEVRLQRLFDPSLPAVAGHPDSLIQVFLNLTRNALQAVRDVPAGTPREVRFTTRIERGIHLARGRETGERTRALRIDVEDTGPGIPPEMRPRLFSPFATSKAKGTGLGLAISQRIVSDHGGTIRFESRPGRTTFRVLLPEWAGETPSS